MEIRKAAERLLGVEDARIAMEKAVKAEFESIFPVDRGFRTSWEEIKSFKVISVDEVMVYYRYGYGDIINEDSFKFTI